VRLGKHIGRGDVKTRGSSSEHGSQLGDRWREALVTIVFCRNVYRRLSLFTDTLAGPPFFTSARWRPAYRRVRHGLNLHPNPKGARVEQRSTPSATLDGAKSGTSYRSSTIEVDLLCCYYRVDRWSGKQTYYGKTCGHQVTVQISSPASSISPVVIAGVMSRLLRLDQFTCFAAVDSGPSLTFSPFFQTAMIVLVLTIFLEGSLASTMKLAFLPGSRVP